MVPVCAPARRPLALKQAKGRHARESRDISPSLREGWPVRFLVIASIAKQSSGLPPPKLDCFVAALLAMTGPVPTAGYKVPLMVRVKIGP